jgi:hypothetical protein
MDEDGYFGEAVAATYDESTAEMFALMAQLAGLRLRGRWEGWTRQGTFHRWRPWSGYAVPVGGDRPAGHHAVGDVGHLLGQILVHDAPFPPAIRPVPRVSGDGNPDGGRRSTGRTPTA